MITLAGLTRTIREHPNYTLNYILFRLGCLLGHRNYRRFIILTRGRTGSNMLLQMLNSHPNVYTEGEIFMYLQNKSLDYKLSRIYRRVPWRLKAVGFKLFYDHPVDDTSGALWDKLKAMPDLHVIHLRRNNYLRTLTSIEIGLKTRVHTQVTDDLLPLTERQIHFDKDELAQGLERLKASETAFANMFQSHHIIDISYEDLVDNPNGILHKVLDFLGLKPSMYKVTLKRQNPEPLSDLITNYHDLKQAFQDTEWACCFQD